MNVPHDLETCSKNNQANNINWYLQGEPHSNQIMNIAQPYLVDNVKPVHITSKIHFNPDLYESRNIYVNKNICSANLRLKKMTQHKDRVYYNPKFLQARKDPENITKDVYQNKENKILLNPLFIKNEREINMNILPKNENKISVSNGIYVNPKFIKTTTTSISLCEPTLTTQNISTAPTALDESNVLKDKSLKIRHISKYKLIRNQSDVCSNTKKNVQIPYWMTYKRKTKCISPLFPKYCTTKYTLKRCNQPMISKVSFNQFPVRKHCRSLCSYVNPASKSILRSQIEARRKGRKYSASFKFSKYKYISSNSEKNIIKREISPNSYRKNHYFKAGPFGTDVRLKSKFQYINQSTLVLKSILRKKIESRRLVKKSPFYLKRFNNEHITKYKLIRYNNVSIKKDRKVTESLSNSEKDDIRKKLFTFTSKYKILKKRKTSLMKKLKKNNQPCPFYSRFGRCKGKDKGTCSKLHDPKFIAMCKKYLKDECKEKNCLLSHDIRPEKMPTCHHYLSGICKRANCPYLHIKVNEKAPICRSFLQGFCADVFSCRKRHEYICPIYAEKGSCPKGKCAYPHRNSVTHSKLLEPDQVPILESTSKTRKKRQKICSSDEVSKTESQEVSGPSEVHGEEQNKRSKDPSPPRTFSRYFLEPLSSESIDNMNEKS